MKSTRDLRAYAEHLVASTDPSKGGYIARRAAAQPLPRTGWARRVAVVLGSAGIFVGANVGLALAANASVPGDPLYGIDRAYEKIEAAIGLHPNLVAERFREAAALTQRGETTLAFETASEAMRQLGPGSHALDVLAQVAEGMKASEVLPADVQDRLNDQARELFGIGEAVSEAATSELTDFENRSEEVLAAIRSAMQDRGQALPPGLERNEPPGQSGRTPPGQDGTAGKSDEAPGRDGQTPGNSQNP